MKANLEFDLNDHDDRMAHMRCVKSTDMAIVIFELGNIKKRILHKIEATEDNLRALGQQRSPVETVEEVFEEIFKELEERNINIDELIE